jgi:uncharacterized damage-inducible protein DinB
MVKALTALLFASCALAQGPAGPVTIARVYDNQLRTAEREIVPLAEAMPAEKFAFAPAAGEFKGVRTFAQQAKHLSAVLYVVSAAAMEEKPPVDPGKDENGPETITSKDQIVKFLKDAFAYAHKAAATLTAENEIRMVKSPWGQGEVAKAGLLQLATWHSFDHYGQMVVYARMNGIVPPASRQN